MGEISTTLPLKFNLADAERAQREWNCNCGPGAIAAVLGMSLDELRPHMGDFEAKGYTNPTLMREIMRNLRGGRFQWRPYRKGEGTFPRWGLARVQWGGPWTAEGSNPRWAYRHTHWVGAEMRDGAETRIFDINAICAGGWLGYWEWSQRLVPWLLKEVAPRADGQWWITHAVEVQP